MRHWYLFWLPRPSDGPTATSLRIEQVAIAARNTPFVLLFNSVNAFVSAYVFRDAADHGFLASWLALFMAAVTGRWFQLRRVKAAPEPGERHISGLALFAAMFGLLWGGFALAVFPSAPLLHQTFIVVVLAGTAAGAAATFACVPAAAILNILACLVPAIGLGFWIGGEVYLLMAVMASGYVALLVASVQHAYRSVFEAVELRARNQRLLREAEEASRAKSEFLANMSHELRTPLNAVIGFSELMQTQSLGPLGSPRYVEYASDISASGRHLLQLIDEILDLSKVEAGAMHLSEQTCDVAELLDSSVRIAGARARQAGIEMRVEVESGLPPVRGDDLKIRQVLLNLLSNAVKFTPPGGTISIRAGRDGTGGLRIAVTDTGIGIAPADLERVMQPFVQVESASTRSRGGTGLGLPLARRLAELHGGTVTLESHPGAGTTAVLRVPAIRLG
jgi:signal transduction histidine kinase